MICIICKKYSSHSSEVNTERFTVDGIAYYFPVCHTSKDGRFTEHTDAQERIEEIVRSEIAKKKKEEEEIRQRAKEILEKQEAEFKANQERAAKENEERDYRETLAFYHSHFNKRAIRELYKEIKEIVESGENGDGE